MSSTEAAGGSSAPNGGEDADTTITLNGNNPVVWQLGTAWQDIGALFTYDGQSETLYSTTPVDTTISGTATIDYWPQVPGAEWLHTTRAVVIPAPANTSKRQSCTILSGAHQRRQPCSGAGKQSRDPARTILDRRCPTARS